MKTLKQLIVSFSIFIIGLFGFSLDASANGKTINYSISVSKNEVSPGNTFDVSILINGHTKVASADITLTYDSTKFKYENLSTPSNVPIADRDANDKGGKIIYSYFDGQGGPNGITSNTLVTFTFKALESATGSGTFTFTAGDTLDENAKFYTVGTKSGSKSVSIYIPDSNNLLANLSLSAGSLSPQFNKNTTKYTAVVDADNVTISAQAESSKARVDGVGNKKLNYGENNFNILVTSETGSEKSYLVTITRPDHRNTDATLSELNVTGIEGFKFKKDTYAYNYTVPNDVTKINVTGKVNNPKSTATGFGSYNLKVGKNNIVVKVTAENQSTKSYVIQITREGTVSDTTTVKSSNCYLSNIWVEGATIVFNKELTEYEMFVPYSQSILNMTYYAEHKNANVQLIGDKELKVGNNSIALVVTAEDGTMKTYNLTIVRGSDVTNVENDINSIVDGLNAGSSSLTIGVKAGASAVTLNEESVDILKNKNKALVFEWLDSNSIVQKRLTIDGTKISDESTINPNISTTIQNNELINFVKDNSYIGVNTKNLNIPTGSKYRVKVDGSLSTYTLGYYSNGKVETKELAVNNGYIDFELDKDMEYVILGATLKEEDKFGWLFPTLVIVILALVFSIVGIITYRNYKNKNLENLSQM